MMPALCLHCPYATDCGGVTFCPFVDGSCIYYKGTILSPKPNTITTRLLRISKPYGTIIRKDEDTDE